MDNFTYKYSVLCQKSIIDKTTNNISLIDIIERLELKINASSYKQSSKGNSSKGKTLDIPLALELVSFWFNNNKTKDIDIKIEFISPSKKVLFEFKPNFKFDSTKKNLRTYVKILGLTLSNESGEYRFVIKYKNKSKSKYKVIDKIPLVVNMKIQ